MFDGSIDTVSPMAPVVEPEDDRESGRRHSFGFSASGESSLQLGPPWLLLLLLFLV